MTNVERIARVIFGGDSHDVTRRAANQFLPDGLLAELGLTRRASHLGAALTFLGAGVVLGAAGYHVFGPNGAPVRARIFQWLHTLGKEAEAATETELTPATPPTDGAARHATSQHS